MRSLVNNLEKIFSEISSSCYPYDWDENHITHSLMKEMRDLFTQRRVRYKGFTKIIDWFSYKNKGKVETTFGDISLFVNVQFKTGEVLRGVAFLEAKRDNNNSNFDSLAISQLERIIQNAPYSHLLLYLHRADEWPTKFPDDGTWESNFWASPNNTAIPKLRQLSPSTNNGVLKVALPFSMLLTSRFFWGLDLDYRENAFKMATEGLGDFPAPPFLGIVNVYYEGQLPINVALDDKWELL